MGKGAKVELRKTEGGEVDGVSTRRRPSKADPVSGQELRNRGIVASGSYRHYEGSSTLGSPALFSPNRNTSSILGNSELSPNRVLVGGQLAESPKVKR